MKIERLVLGTSNPGKIKEWKKLLGDSVELLEISSTDIESPEEQGNNYREIARNKAKYYARKFKEFVLSEDGGFEIDALGGLPGIKSRRILPGEKDGTDEELINFVLEKLEGVPREKRTARLAVYVVLVDPQGSAVFEDMNSIEGVITEQKIGDYEAGYPYRAILFVPEAGKIFSEFDENDREQHSHRRPIADRLKKFLLEYDR